MIHVLAAIECEVSPLRHLISEDLEIVITGIGKVNAAFAVGRLFPNGLTRKVLSSDVIINIGTCGAKDLHGLYLVNKITDLASGKDYYPDVLRVSGLKEASLHTADALVTSPRSGVLYDMEASAIYQTAGRLISPDRMIFLKAVSDNGDVKGVTEETVKQLIGSFLPQIESVIDQVRKSLVNKELPQDNTDLYEKLHATASMKVQIDEVISFAKSLGVDGNELFEKEMEGVEAMTRARSKEVIARVKSVLAHLY